MGAISDFMGRDHDRLDEIFAGLRRERDAARAKELFLQFDSGLRAHIVWEEEILFPVFEDRTGMKNSGPTAVMRMEHDQIKHHLQTLKEGATQGDPGRVMDALLEVLAGHNQKEEHILYPWLDQFLSHEEASSLVERFKQL